MTAEVNGTRHGVRLKGLSVRNFKAIESLDLSFVGADGAALEKVLFIGANASGKTSLLEAIGLLLTGVAPSASDPDGSGAARFPAREFQLTGEPEGPHWRDGDRLGVGTRDLRSHASGRVRHPQWLRLGAQVLAFAADTVAAQEQPGAPEHLWTREIVLKDLSDKLAHLYTRRLQTRRRDENATDAFDLVQTAWSRFERAQTGIEVIQEGNNPASPFVAVLRDRREIPPDITSLAMARELGATRPDIPSMVTLAQLSAGQQKLFTFIAPLVFRDKPPDVVLVDEAEGHLHPTWASELVPALRAASPRAQFFFTTHSPYLVDQFKPEEIFVLGRDTDGRVSCSRLSDYPDIERLMGALSTGELWTNVGEKWVIDRARLGQPNG